MWFLRSAFQKLHYYTHFLHATYHFIAPFSVEKEKEKKKSWHVSLTLILKHIFISAI